MGIAWCRERLEHAQNSKNPVDRILIRCSNVIKPKTYSRSQDRLADDIVYRGVRTKDLGTVPPSAIHVVPPRSRNRVRGMSDWQACALVVPDAGDAASVAPIPPPRKKRKRKMNGDVAAEKSLTVSCRKLVENKDNVNVVTELIREKPGGEQRTQNRFVKLSEIKAGKTNGVREEKPKAKVAKNVSTVSLPNYNDLVKPTGKENEKADVKTEAPAGDSKFLRRTQSTMSLPGEGTNSILSSLSEATIHRLETYMKRCRSFGSLKPQQLLEKLEEFDKSHRSASESSDSWSGLDDWDLGIIEYFDPETANVPPLTPKSTLPPRSKIFSVGTPQETPKRQSPVSEVEDEEEAKPKQQTKNERKTIEFKTSDEYDSILNRDCVPGDWFSDTDKQATAMKVEMQNLQNRAMTPPPSPESGLVDETNENEPSQSSLIEILTKYKNEEMSDIGSARRESVSENSSKSREGEEEDDMEAAITEIESKSHRKPKSRRARSSSLMEINPKFLHEERFGRRTPSIGFESTTRLLDELTRNSGVIEKEFMSNPEQLLNGLRRASLCENLPEDPFDIYLQRKKTSLRESLNVFLGFNQGESGSKKEEKSGGEEEKLPPPLPLNPPPIITMNVPEPSDSLASYPLVTVTSDNDKN